MVDRLANIERLREYNDRLRYDLDQRDAELRRAWASADQLATAVAEQDAELQQLRGAVDRIAELERAIIDVAKTDDYYGRYGRRAKAELALNHPGGQ